jgi:hypothetical protein
MTGTEVFPRMSAAEQRYANRAEAERAASCLTAIGCPARVIGPDDLDLDGERSRERAA